MTQFKEYLHWRNQWPSCLIQEPNQIQSQGELTSKWKFIDLRPERPLVQTVSASFTPPKVVFPSQAPACYLPFWWLMLQVSLDRALLHLHYFHCLYYTGEEVHRKSAYLPELFTYVKRSLDIEALLHRLVWQGSRTLIEVHVPEIGNSSLQDPGRRDSIISSSFRRHW